MASLGELEGKLSDVESSLAQYDANLPSEIESQIKKAYTPALQRSLDTTKNLMSDYGQRYFDVTTMGPGMAGTTAKDLAPTQKLGVMGRELGTMAGNLQSSQQFSDYLGGQMNDMYSKALQASQMGQQNLADKYGRLFNQYQMAWEAAEAEKNRALQRSLAAQQIAAMSQGGAEDDFVIQTDEGGEEPPQEKDRNWTSKMANVADKDTFGGSVLTGYDVTSKSENPWAIAGGVFNPLGTVAKSIAGGVGNLIGNTRNPVTNQNMSFWDKVMNQNKWGSSW
jgi:hypothetical protein